MQGATVPSRDNIEVIIHSADVSIVTLRGEHDIGSRNEVITALTVAAGSSNILVDLLDIDFIDSSVIGAILTASRLARQREGTLELVTPGCTASRRALQLNGTRDLLQSHETRSAGLASIEAAVSAKIDGLHAKFQADRAPLTAKRAGIIARAHVVDQSATESEEQPAELSRRPTGEVP
jgi:anti-sigma B factor antagonist